MPDYVSVLSRESVAFVVSLSKQKQIRVLEIADRIAFAPERVSDLTQTDSSGRYVESVLIDEFLFNYWIDHAAKEVRISEIHEV